VSKVQGTFSVYEACKYWWLRSYDVMQGVIYGNYSEELQAHSDLNTRFDIDEWWGTVVNRFVAQAVIGMPLTIYGSGNQNARLHHSARCHAVHHSTDRRATGTGAV
jgi:UDP-sulfoquinovose synthase